jgi:hypothetical protein
MNRFLAVLDKDTQYPDTTALTTAHASRPTTQSRAIVDLMTHVFPDANPPQIVAFAGIARGAGVSSTLRTLAAAVENETGRRACIVTAADVNSWKRSARTPGVQDPDGPAGVKAFFTRLLTESDCVFVDCEPVDSSADLSRVASLVDGVVVVVEAGVTRKAQIERAVAMIRAANGRCLGVVLNKRRYPIPNWLYRCIG